MLLSACDGHDERDVDERLHRLRRGLIGVSSRLVSQLVRARVTPRVHGAAVGDGRRVQAAARDLSDRHVQVHQLGNRGVLLATALELATKLTVVAEGHEGPHGAQANQIQETSVNACHALPLCASRSAHRVLSALTQLPM